MRELLVYRRDVDKRWDDDPANDGLRMVVLEQGGMMSDMAADTHDWADDDSMSAAETLRRFGALEPARETRVSQDPSRIVRSTGGRTAGVHPRESGLQPREYDFA